MKNVKYLILFINIAIAFSAFSQRPFTAGNIVVYRAGDGTVTLPNNATAVFLDEYTPDGVLVQSIAMPTVASGSNNMLTTRGTVSAEGTLHLSGDGKYLVVPGRNTAPGGGNISAAAVIGLVDFNGKVNTSTSVTFSPGSNNTPWSAISDDGNRIWFGTSTTGILYTTVGNNTAVTVSAPSPVPNVIDISNGQLYMSGTVSSSPGVFSVGSGLPTTTGQTPNTLPGLSAVIGNNDVQAFAFADLDANVPGDDVLYITSMGVGPGTIGIHKLSLVGGVWTGNGNIGLGTDRYSALTLRVTGNTVTLYAIRRGPNDDTRKGGEVVKMTDNSGYNGAFAGTPAVISDIVNRFGTANVAAFRGVALVPQPAPFTAGNIVVYRAGDGTVTLPNNATAVFLDEYTPNGVLVQSIAMPTVASGSNNMLTTRGTVSAEGTLHLSGDGKYLVVPGRNTAPGGGNISAAAVIGLVDFNGKVNTSTSVTFSPGSNNTPWSAISDDGNRIWFGTSTTGILYTTVGNNTAVTVSAPSPVPNVIDISNGQLYMSGTVSSSPGVFSVGSGLPTTTGQTPNTLPGLSAVIGNNDVQAFAFADLDANVPGDDVLYITSMGVGPGTIGIHKLSLVGGVWTGNGNIGLGTDRYSALTLRVTGNTVTLYAIRRGPNDDTRKGGEVVKITDNGGYNGAFAGTPAVVVSVATPNTMAFRGVARVPLNCPSVTGLRVPDISATQANLFWNAVSSGINYEYLVTTSSTPPVTGTITGSTSASISGLINGTTYYVHVRTICNSKSNSEWATTSFVTGCKPPAVPVLKISFSSNGVTTIKWNKVFGTSGYEYSISTSSTPPTSGTLISDTIINTSGLNSVTKYYVHIRSICDGGTFSNWVTKSFTTGCFMPMVNITVLPGNVGTSWNKINNAINYEYAMTATAAKPQSGSITVDTFYTSGKLNEGTGHYFHVRSICSGSVSDWNSVRFNLQGLQAYPNPVKDILQISLYEMNNSKGEILIGDAMGRIVHRLKMTANTVTVDTKGWAAGIYLIRYSDGSYKYTTRILKQ